jgi:hypothetical protein
VIALTPSRLRLLMAEAERMFAEKQLAVLFAVNHGMAGGDDCEKYADKLKRQIGETSDTP